METFLTDLAEQRDALCIIQDIHIGKHEGVSPVFTLRTAETPPLYLICRNSVASENLQKKKKTCLQPLTLTVNVAVGFLGLRCFDCSFLLRKQRKYLLPFLTQSVSL